MVPGHHGGSTRTITGAKRGAPVPWPASLYVYIPGQPATVRTSPPSVPFAVTWRLLSLSLSRANTSPNRRFYGPPSTFNEGTLRGGIFSLKVSGLVDNFRITTSHSPFFQLLLLSVFFFSFFLSLDRLQI